MKSIFKMYVFVLAMVVTVGFSTASMGQGVMVSSRMCSIDQGGRTVFDQSQANKWTSSLQVDRLTLYIFSNIQNNNVYIGQHISALGLNVGDTVWVLNLQSGLTSTANRQLIVFKEKDQAMAFHMLKLLKTAGISSLFLSEGVPSSITSGNICDMVILWGKHGMTMLP